MYHHQDSEVFAFNARDFTKKLILHFSRNDDVNSYQERTSVSSELRRIKAIPNHSDFSDEFASYFPNPRNSKQVIGLNLLANKVKVAPEGQQEFYDTLLIFHVFEESKKDEATYIKEAHVVMDGSKALKGWKSDNYVLSMIGKYYFIRNLSHFALIDSSNYTVLQCDHLSKISGSENFTGFDLVANKIYTAEYPSKNTKLVEYKVWDSAFDPSLNFADELARDIFNTQVLESSSTKKAEEKKQQPLRFGVLLKGEGESEGSNSDSEWDEKAQDIFKIAGG